MKTFTTMTAVAALIAGLSFAHAQNAPKTDTQNPPPSSINAGSQEGTTGQKSGSQTGGTAAQSSSAAASDKMTWKGAGKFCISQSAGSLEMDCKFASIEACQSEAKPRNLNCLPNGNAGTTGMNQK